MYKIPEDIDLSALISSEIQQVCFSANAIFLSLEGGNGISIESDFELEVDGSKNEKKLTFPVNSDLGLLRLVGKKIVSSYVNNDRNILALGFDNSDKLTLRSSVQFESFEILIDGNRIII